MTDFAVALLAASLWIVGPAIAVWRIRRSRSFTDVSTTPESGAPTVTIIVPARDEARNIASCVRAALASTYPAVEVVIVDDRSTDGTGDVARAASGGDPRLRVIENPELPDGWFGKPWACTTGARAAAGEILCFTDADARHGTMLVARAVHAMRAEQLDMVSVLGHQELGSFWERVVQPHVFWFIGTRYGGTESVNKSPRVKDKIANGQCIFVRRDAYEAIGGHGAVRDQVAEDVAIAQRLFAAGKRTALFLGRADLATRMYTSLAEIMAGWRKNMFAGGREAMPWGRFGQVIFPALLLIAPALNLLPTVVAIGSALIGAPTWLMLGALIALGAQMLTWALVYRWMDAPVRYALLFPLGAAVVGLIAVQAIARGSHVEWKGRRYVTTSSVRSTTR